MQVELLSLDAITPYDSNPRIMRQEKVEKLAQLLKKFGFRQPIVVDENRVIVVGTRRYWAAKLLGLTEAPVHVAHDLSAEQIKAYRLADNKAAEDGEWDDTLLTAELLDLSDLGIDVTDFGFKELSSENDMPFIDAPPAGSAEPEAADAENDDKSEKRLSARDHMVSALFYMSDIRSLEAAITKTGEKNRAKALAKICTTYLNDGIEAFELDMTL